MTDLTPKQVSRAIGGVSESSIKRWCDRGVIDSQKTAGGHRRIPVASLIQFLRQGQYELERPELLGLPAAVGRTRLTLDAATEPFAAAVVSGDEQQLRRILLDLYLSEHALSSICDRVVARAFVEVGRLWECGDAEVYQERRGVALVQRALGELLRLLPPVPAGAPLALGGAVEGDQYSLAAGLVELVLRDAGWQVIACGSNLPFATLAAAIRDHRPRMFWLSCSYIADEAQFIAGYRELYDEFGAEVAFVVGGRTLSEVVRRQLRYTAYCDNVGHLEAVAQTLKSQSGRGT